MFISNTLRTRKEKIFQNCLLKIWFLKSSSLIMSRSLIMILDIWALLISFKLWQNFATWYWKVKKRRKLWLRDYKPLTISCLPKSIFPSWQNHVEIITFFISEWVKPKSFAQRHELPIYVYSKCTDLKKSSLKMLIGNRMNSW